MKQYLVLTCNGDDYEYTKPCCLTTDISSYGLGYEIWELHGNGTFTLYKNASDYNEHGMIIATYDADTDKLLNLTKKMVSLDRTNYNTAKKVKDIAKSCGFTEKLTDIAHEIAICGEYGEEVDGKWVVFGEYADTYYPKGC